MTDTPTLLTNDEARAHIGHDITYSILDRWIRNGAVTPTRPAAGSGSQVGWTPHEVLRLQAIATVRHDLEHLGLPCPWKLVRELWDQLDTADTAGLHTGTVTITVHIGLEVQ